MTLGGDKNYDTQGCVAKLRALGHSRTWRRTPARRGGSAIDGRTTRHPGYALSQRVRKRVEEIFGWLKTVGGCARRASGEGAGGLDVHLGAGGLQSGPHAQSAGSDSMKRPGTGAQDRNPARRKAVEANHTASADPVHTTFGAPEFGLKRNLLVKSHFSSAC